jgi:hypothetical protein
MVYFGMGIETPERGLSRWWRATSADRAEAPADYKPPASTGHSSTITVQCNGSGEFADDFTTNANARFGQKTEVAAFNAHSPDGPMPGSVRLRR